MLPFMFVEEPLVLLFGALVLPMFELLWPMFEFDMFEFDMFEFVVVPIFELLWAAFVLLWLMFEFDMFEFDMFELVFVFSAGEQADQTPATVSKARRAKVLRIEFPPVPSKGSACWGAARSSRGRCRRSGSVAARCP